MATCKEDTKLSTAIRAIALSRTCKTIAQKIHGYIPKLRLTQCNMNGILRYFDQLKEGSLHYRLLDLNAPAYKIFLNAAHEGCYDWVIFLSEELFHVCGVSLLDAAFRLAVQGNHLEVAKHLWRRISTSPMFELFFTDTYCKTGHIPPGWREVQQEVIRQYRDLSYVLAVYEQTEMQSFFTNEVFRAMSWMRNNTPRGLRDHHPLYLSIF